MTLLTRQTGRLRRSSAHPLCCQARQLDGVSWRTLRPWLSSQHVSTVPLLRAFSPISQGRNHLHGTGSWAWPPISIIAGSAGGPWKQQIALQAFDCPCFRSRSWHGNVSHRMGCRRQQEPGSHMMGDCTLNTTNRLSSRRGPGASTRLGTHPSGGNPHDGPGVCGAAQLSRYAE